MPVSFPSAPSMESPRTEDKITLNDQELTQMIARFQNLLEGLAHMIDAEIDEDKKEELKQKLPVLLGELESLVREYDKRNEQPDSTEQEAA